MNKLMTAKHPLEDAPLTHPLAQENPYLNSLMIRAKSQPRTRLLIGTPVTGLVRVEWVHARYSQMVPPNWSSAESLQPLHQSMPLGFAVAEARNVIAHIAVVQGYEWMIWIDHDVVLPPDAFVRFNEYIREVQYPLVTGLYFIKGHPTEPLAYRGRGTGAFMKFRIGDKKWLDGCGFGCLLMHVSVLKAMYADAPEYVAGGTFPCRKVFDTPYAHFYDQATGAGQGFQGTEDLSFFDRMMQGNYLAKAGWPAIAKRRFPILFDSAISCGHITPDGQIFPFGWRPYQPPAVNGLEQQP